MVTTCYHHAGNCSLYLCSRTTYRKSNINYFNNMPRLPEQSWPAELLRSGSWVCWGLRHVQGVALAVASVQSTWISGNFLIFQGDIYIFNFKIKFKFKFICPYKGGKLNKFFIFKFLNFKFQITRETVKETMTIPRKLYL